MDLQITGTVKEILDLQSGEGKNGPWRKQDFILETQDKYPKLVCITQWGDQIDKNNIKKGDEITAHIDIQSREYKGNWYTDVKAWKINQGGEKSSRKDNPEENDIDFGADEDMPF